MKLRTIKPESYARISANRPQVLTKDRGYGVIYFTHEALIFALPLRSNLNHPNGFKTLLDKRSKTWNGIDYTKVLIVSEDDLMKEAFKPRDTAEYDKIQNNSEKIKTQFILYLTEYVKAVKSGKPLDRKFTFTTLQYFHAELGLN